MFKKSSLSLVASVFVLALVSCQLFAVTRTGDGFPDIWWKSVPASDVKGWEITPDSVSRENGEVVLSKRNELGVFSNLSEAHFILDGQAYASIEGLWQGMKYPENAQDERAQNTDVKWPYTREQVYAMSGFEAKKAGDVANENMQKLGIKWITYQGKKIEYKTESGKIEHYNLIYRASQQKVFQNENIKDLLLKTKNLKFFPDHKQFPNADPVYGYFDMYMKIRSEISSNKKD